MRLKRKIKFISLGLFLSLILIVSIYFSLSYFFPFPLEKLNQRLADRSSATVFGYKNEVLRSFLGKKDSWTFEIPLKKVSPHVINALIATEDERFYFHLGVDPISICRAILSNIRSCKKISGASTITMQCMRMTFGGKRTFYTKIIESFRAFQIEQIYSKDEILEYYLNVAPFGGNYYGIEAASKHFFNKSASDLNLSEAALLTGLPQRPSGYRPDKYPEKAKKRRDFVLDRMLTMNFISKKECKIAQNQAVSLNISKHPFHAPHFTRLLKKKYSDKKKILTTLRPQIQDFAQCALRKKLSSLHNVDNGAVVVIENSSGAVLSMVGAPNFFDSLNNGQVNAAICGRSPGSALKPFVYSLRFENSELLPSSFISDAPLNINGYVPQNYDLKFHGRVSVSEALRYSYNIPAVQLLHKAGVDNFMDFLKDCGISTLEKNPSHYGLSLILGSADITLLDLTSAYTIFPNNGIYKPYTFLEEKIFSSRRVISQASAFLTVEILKNSNREPKNRLILNNNDFDFSWKTGTSYAHHDAWTIGFTHTHTVGIWLGNVNGTASRELVGADVAAPLCAEILKEISKNNKTNLSIPQDIKKIEICCITGKPASLFCDKKEEAFISKNKLYRGCQDCKKYHSNNPIVKTLPKSKKLKIISPEKNTYISIPLSKKSNSQKLQLKVEETSDTIYWFIDNKFYGKTRDTQQLFWTIKKGNYQVSCSNSAGQSANMRIVVH
ncbi:MAG: penicillin-binding protein 1C [Verrucomicrobiota bacterium]|nr:penicillin-binding protein 1C [Verrucomicrobiota bacterium]